MKGNLIHWILFDKPDGIYMGGGCFEKISNLFQTCFIVDKFLLIVHYLFGGNNKKLLHLQKIIKITLGYIILNDK